VEVYHKDGTTRWLEVDEIPVFDSDGRVIGVQGLAHDITDRKRTEEALKENITRFQNLAEITSDCIWEVNENAVISYVSPKVRDILGYKPEEMLGKTLFDFMTREEAHRVRKIFRQFADNRESFSCLENTILHKNGHPVILETSGVPIFREDGRFCGFRGIDRDITDQKRFEDRIVKLDALKEQLLDPCGLPEKLNQITDGVVSIFDADFARIWIVKEGDLCDKGCRHAEVKEGPHVCRHRDRCLHLTASSGRYPRTDGTHQRVPLGCYKIGRIASGEEPQFVTNEVSRDPRVHDPAWAESLGLISFTGFRLRSKDGRPIGVLALFSKHVITAEDVRLLESLANTASQVILTGRIEDALRESEYRLRKTRDELEIRVRERTAELVRSNADLERFAHIASHDLQEPLRMVASYVGFLERKYADQLDATAREFIGYAVEGAMRMSCMIKGILEYSRINTDGKALEPTDANAVLEQSLNNLRWMIEQYRAQVTHDPLPRVQADDVQLARVFQNLIENAIKFRDENQTPVIHISTERQEDGT